MKVEVGVVLLIAFETVVAHSDILAAGNRERKSESEPYLTYPVVLLKVVFAA